MTEKIEINIHLDESRIESEVWKHVEDVIRQMFRRGYRETGEGRTAVEKAALNALAGMDMREKIRATASALVDGAVEEVVRDFLKKQAGKMLKKEFDAGRIDVARMAEILKEPRS